MVNIHAVAPPLLEICHLISELGANRISTDDSIDIVLRRLRAVQQDPSACIKSLESLIAVLDALDKQQ